MKPHYLIPVLVVLPGLALAECGPARQTILSCSLDNGRLYLDVCLSQTSVTLKRGLTGATPDLSLTVPITKVAYTPWPGISTFNESITFSDGDIAWVAYIGETRIYSPETEADPGTISSQWHGGLEKIRNLNGSQTEYLSDAACDTESVVFPYDFALSDAKAAAGLCWNLWDQKWSDCDKP
ncbi:MAG TPA: hypothetical protein ENK28_07200 [Aliiroseovarius sp.]|nr:hypothetical protein [Aliiroseovarius sp.]